MEQLCLPFVNLNDTEFLNYLNDNDQHLFPFHVIDNITYNPLKYDDLANISIDGNIQEPICNYVFTADSYMCVTEPNLSVLAHNISSIPLHLDSCLDQCISVSSNRYDVLGFCETRLNDSICQLYSIEGYNNYFNNKGTQGGGLALYLNSKFQARVLNNLTYQFPHIEALFLEITHPHQFVIGLVYRPPNSNFEDFISSVSIMINETSALKLPIYIMGDYNVNIFNYSGQHAKNLVNLFHTYSFFCTINKPTRVTNTSATIIDHIWTNNIENHIKSGIIFDSTSDHFPVFSQFSLSSGVTSDHSTFTSRNFTTEAIEAFKAELSNFVYVLSTFSVNYIFENYIENFRTLYDKHFPVKTVKIKGSHLNKPYITTAIKQSIKQRNKLQKLYAKWPLTYEASFKQYRNQLTSVIRAAKQQYYTQRLSRQAGDTKKTWQTINNLLGRKRPTLPTCFDFDGNSVTGNLNLAQHFNDYFSSVGSISNNTTPDGLPTFNTYMPDPVSFSFFLRPTSLEEIKSVIHNLKISSPGHDDIHIKVIKECSDIISPFLVYIVNKSFQEGCFPDHLKIARVTPIFKKGEKHLPHNYRPISVLCSISKVFEKVMVNRLMNYLTTNSQISPTQYGFRPSYSTDLAVHHISQNIYNTLDDNKYQITLFCDFTKAFDTISHNILLEKLYNYGIRGKAHSWFRSYLLNRKQYTSFNNTSSSCNVISCGVPQGSILGPVLFLLYINDITRCTDKVKFLLYADDTTIFIQGSNLHNISITLNNELNQVTNWIKANRLNLNLNKTQYMVSCPLMTRSANTIIKLDNIVLKEVNEFKFLGVILDNKLKWKSHIETIQTKVSLLTGVMYKIRSYLNENSLRQLYFTLIYPYFYYCSAIWGGAYKTYADSLFVTQKKLLRIMYFKNRYEHTHCLFKESRILKLHDVIYLQTSLFVHKALYTCTLYHGYTPLPYTATRRPKQLRAPLCRTSHAQQSVLTRGTRIWNTLPNHLLDVPTKNYFKCTLVASIFEKYAT